MDIILFAAALLPAVALMFFVYSRDKVDKEPVGLVLRVLALGAASGIVAGIVESILIGGLEAIVPYSLFQLVIEYFICVAAVEEACKYFCLNTVKNNPAFDHVFDAVVYAVAAALGFAALENVFYVFDPIDGGIDTAVMRAILSVPGHAADGVVMGVFYGLARQRELNGNKSGARSYYWLAFLLPVIEHGFYDMALSMDSDFMALLAMGFDLAFVGVAFYLVNHAASKDAPLRPQGAQGMQGQPQLQPLQLGQQRQQPPQGQPYQQGQPYPMGQPMQQRQPFQQSQMQQPQPMQQPQQPQPVNPDWYCPNCGTPNSKNFCVNCGAPRP